MSGWGILNWREDIVSHQFLAEQNRVLKIVPTPRHKSDKDIFTKSQFSSINGGAICQHLPFFDRLTNLDHRRLGHTSVLIRTLKLDQVIGIQKSSTLPLIIIFFTQFRSHHDSTSMMTRTAP